MLKVIIVLTTVCGVLFALSDSKWTIYKAKHSKAYGREEDFLRRMIYEDNLQKIETHNEKYAKGESTFYLGENHFADMTNIEFAKTMNGLRINKPYYESDDTPLNTSLPTTVDWRTKGYVTEVKDQGECDSCWAFSATGSLEGQHFKATNKLVSLSESNLVDCSSSFGNLGCNGGLMDDAFEYIIANKGIDTEKSYPYHDEQEKCKFKGGANVGATMRDYKFIKEGSEQALQQATAIVGPISATIDASHSSFQLYSGGVYNEPDCSSTEMTHGVLVVGYGTDSGKDYWLVKNSVGTDWGEKGYIKMSRNKNNQCGIATSALFPVV